MVDTTTADPALGLPSIFWSPGSTEGLSYEQLKQRRAIAAALASRSRPYPTTIGQGIASLGESFGDAMYERQTQEYERQQRALDRKAAEDASGGKVTTPPPPAAPRARTSEADAPNQTYASLADSILAQPGTSTPPDVSLEPPAASAPQPAPAGGPAPMMTRMTALNTGPTASDAGQPGATYGGPSPAGPGASTAEPPVDNPAAPSALPTAAAAAASPPGPVGTPVSGATGGGQVPRSFLAGQVMAQAGTRPPVPATAPTRDTPPVTPGPIQAAPGTLTQPPAAVGPAPNTYPAPGQSMLPDIPPEKPRFQPPKIGEDTPEMASIKKMLVNPAYRDISPSERARWTGIYQTLKEARDKQDVQKMEEWRRDDQDTVLFNRNRDALIQARPKQRLEQSEAEAKDVDIRRFGSVERKKSLEAAADKEGAASRVKADALPNLYKAIDLVRQGKVISGMFAEGIPYTPMPGKLGISKFMTDAGLGDFKALGSDPGPANEMVQSTEEYQSLIREAVAAGLKAYGANPSTKDLEAAESQYGLSLGLDSASKLRILENIKDKYLRDIRGQADQLKKDFYIPGEVHQRDSATLNRNQVDIPHDPYDVQQLKANPTRAAAIAFDQRYGAGAAARAMGR